MGVVQKKYVEQDEYAMLKKMGGLMMRLLVEVTAEGALSRVRRSLLV